MSLQDDIDFCEYDCLKDEFSEFSNEFEKSMEEIDNLLDEINSYKKNDEKSLYKKVNKVRQVYKKNQTENINELLPFFILMCYQLNNYDDNIPLLLKKEDRIIQNKENQLIVYKYYYSNTNIYFEYLYMIDYYVKYIIRECC